MGERPKAGSRGAGRRPGGSEDSPAASGRGGPPGSRGSAVGSSEGQPPRRLGVIEAFTVVTRSCPSGAVRAVAENALEAVKREGAKVLPEQAYLVLTACRGWHGDRATRVKESLRAFLDMPADRPSRRGPEG